MLERGAGEVRREAVLVGAALDVQDRCPVVLGGDHLDEPLEGGDAGA